MKDYYVYILLCSDGSYYTGVTSNLQRRFSEHQAGLYRGYTAFRLPVSLVYSMRFSEIDQAIEAEKRIKRRSRRKKQALIDGDVELLRQLAECRNDSHYRRFHK